jgi:hypothetical protein
MKRLIQRAVPMLAIAIALVGCSAAPSRVLTPSYGGDHFNTGDIEIASTSPSPRG